jgi:hypothetical protein
MLLEIISFKASKRLPGLGPSSWISVINCLFKNILIARVNPWVQTLVPHLNMSSPLFPAKSSQNNLVIIESSNGVLVNWFIIILLVEMYIFYYLNRIWIHLIGSLLFLKMDISKINRIEWNLGDFI